MAIGTRKNELRNPNHPPVKSLDSIDGGAYPVSPPATSSSIGKSARMARARKSPEALAHPGRRRNAAPSRNPE